MGVKANAVNPNDISLWFAKIDACYPFDPFSIATDKNYHPAFVCNLCILQWPSQLFLFVFPPFDSTLDYFWKSGCIDDNFYSLGRFLKDSFFTFLLNILPRLRRWYIWGLPEVNVYTLSPDLAFELDPDTF